MPDLVELHTGLLYDLAAGLPGGPQGWALHRLIFRDWWHWRDHALQAALGNIALTGQNEGGKSSLLALAATLLDGDTSPRRLDPAGSADRSLAYFLLGKDGDDPDDPDVFAYKARIGYLAAEFRHGDGRWLTIGMGVDAARTVPGGHIRGWWGFLLPGRRIGVDCEVRGHDGNCLPFAEFRQMLGAVADGETDVPPGAAVVTTRRHVYRRQVNEHLFQMGDDDYRALIEALLSARRPKIAQAAQEGPEKVCRVLQESLPPLPGDQMDNLSQLITNLESHQRDLKELEDHVRWVEGIDERHRALVQVLVQQGAAEYRERMEEYRRVAGQVQRHTRDRDRARQAVNRLEQDIGQLVAARARARAQLDAQQTDAAALAGRLEAAKSRAENTKRTYGTMTETVERIKQGIQGLKQELVRVRKDFNGERDRMSLHLDAWARTDLRWPQAASRLAVVRDAAGGLDPGDPSGKLAAARPDVSFLTGEAAGRITRCTKVRDRLRAVKDREGEFRRQEKRLEELRVLHAQAVDALTRAGERLDTVREELAAEIGEWAGRHPEMEVPDHRLAAVRSAVLDLASVPETGPAEMIAPLRAQGAARSRALGEAARDALVRAGMTRERMAAREEEMGRLREEGLRPPRSPVRAAARRDAPQTRSFYEWIRFRPEVEAGIADTVEAALAEAGLLDLAVGPEEGPNADAWLWTVQPVTGPSLLALLETEEGAPPLVRAALAAIGWGEGTGEHWVSAPGEWRHGLARGRVTPWLSEPPGLVGAERRQRALEGRLQVMRETREALAEQADREEREAAGHQADLLRVEQALVELEGLGWQSLFAALGKVDSAAAAEKQALEAVEGAKPPAEAARQAFDAARTAYLEAVRTFPETESLDDGGLEALIDQLKEFSRAMRSLDASGDHLERLMNEHVRKQEELAALTKQYQDWERGEAAARQELAAVLAEVAALEERMKQPDMVAASGAARRLAAELEQLDQQIAAAGESKKKQEIDAQSAENSLVEREPEAERARQLREEARARLLARLVLHPDLAAAAGRLAEHTEPAPAFFQTLPRPVDDPEQLDNAISRRRSDLTEWILQVRNELGDYGLACSETYDRITFRDEQRAAISAGELLERLQDSADKTRGLIDEEERRLYEEIICNNLVDDLIDLMAKAHDFRERMNRKLADLQASSGSYLSFRLDLRADGVPGVRVGKALRERDAGAQWLTGEQRQHLAGLIRSEVEQAMREARAQNRTIGYLEAIQETLDYRQWYEFQLFRRTGQKSERLKNRGFGTLSSFGRSWALAVPVIAAVAARYDAARNPDVPRLVFLDEIFAGFDPANQATYLRYLRELDLNWIIADPDDLPYSDDLPAVMSYQMCLTRQAHTAYPTLWDGKKVTDPEEVAAQAARMGARRARA